MSTKISGIDNSNNIVIGSKNDCTTTFGANNSDINLNANNNCFYDIPHDSQHVKAGMKVKIKLLLLLLKVTIPPPNVYIRFITTTTMK